jgi:predicted dehydrogenase
MMKVMQIGYGLFGRWWAPQVLEFPGMELVALVDANGAALQEAQELTGLPQAAFFDDLDEALEAVEADVLLCVTPPNFHRAHTTAAMRAGLDVIVEKPLALDMADAQAMADVARETGRLMAVSQNYRYRPQTWTMQREVQKGAIGEIGQIRLDFYKGWYFEKENFRYLMPDPLLMDMAIHHFDLLRFITGLEATSVSGSSWNPPWSENAGDSSVNLTFTLNNGARFVYNASWVAQGDFADWNGNWLIDGSAGSLRLAGNDVEWRQAIGKYQTAEPVLIRPMGPPLQNMAYVLADMMAARAEGRPPATSVFDNLKSLGMVLAAREAVHSGERVEIGDGGLD